MVGPPTSSTAPRDQLRAAACPACSAWCRWMFSTTTIASSTRMPIEKISANSDTRLSVKPQAHDANSVAVERQHRPRRRRSRPRAGPARTTPARPPRRWRTAASGSASSPCRWRSRRSCASRRRARRRGSRCCAARRRAASRASATSIAFSPGFLVIAIVTAGNLARPSLAAPCRARRSAAAAAGRRARRRRPAGTPAGRRARRRPARRRRRRRAGTARPPPRSRGCRPAARRTGAPTFAACSAVAQVGHGHAVRGHARRIELDQHARGPGRRSCTRRACPARA